jgi:hypothetical protein
MPPLTLLALKTLLFQTGNGRCDLGGRPCIQTEKLFTKKVFVSRVYGIFYLCNFGQKL